MATATYTVVGGTSGAAGLGAGAADGTAEGPDILLFHVDDGGEVEIVAGRPTMDDSPATAAYLSLFGGNERDANLASTDSLQWWGNLLEADVTRHYRSETQHLLRSVPAVTFNLARIQQAVERDLAWMEDELTAEITVAVSIPALNRVRIDVTINVMGRVYSFSFVELWQAAVA